MVFKKRKQYQLAIVVKYRFIFGCRAKIDGYFTYHYEANLLLLICEAIVYASHSSYFYFKAFKQGYKLMRIHYKRIISSVDCDDDQEKFNKSCAANSIWNNSMNLSQERNK